MAKAKSTTDVATVIEKQVEANKAEQTVDSFITLAIEKNMPMEVLEKFLLVRRQLNAEAAKKAFSAAMSRFQSECPIIEKTKGGAKTKSGTVAYKYAPIDTIVSAVKHLLVVNGLSYGFKVLTTPSHVKVTCTAKHEFGHQEDTEIEVPMGSKTEIMSMPQMVMATMTYAKRYAFCNAFGIMTGDEDTDAQDAMSQPDTKGVVLAHPNSRKATVEIPEKNGNGVMTITGATPCAGDCGTVIEDQAVLEYSKARFGKPFCRECQNKAVTV